MPAREVICSYLDLSQDEWMRGKRGSGGKEVETVKYEERIYILSFTKTPEAGATRDCSTDPRTADGAVPNPAALLPVEEPLKGSAPE